MSVRVSELKYITNKGLRQALRGTYHGRDARATPEHNNPQISHRGICEIRGLVVVPPVEPRLGLRGWL